MYSKKKKVKKVKAPADFEVAVRTYKDNKNKVTEKVFEGEKPLKKNNKKKKSKKY